MDCRLISFILLFVLIGKLQNVNGFAGYKWISLNSGDTLPGNAARIKHSGTNIRYIGRARHFDEILPAEVFADGTAFVSCCNKRIPKHQFDILTITTAKCEWKTYSSSIEIETMVRVGTAFNNEPIFIGTEQSDDDNHDYNRHYDNNDDDIDNIYSTKNYIIPIYLTKSGQESLFRGYDRYGRQRQLQYLSCDMKTKWIDSSSDKLPNNTVSGGKSEDNYDIYVGQLKRNCDVVTGQVIPKIGTATAVLRDGTDIEAAYCQVLVGEPNQYTWVSASDGEIPDFAVANGFNGLELEYIARFNNTIGHLTYREALADQFSYEILVMNQV